MEVERSNVPGYDATVLTQLAEHERFVLRNPEDRRDLVVVDTVIAFDRGSATDPRPYFRAWGADLDGSNRRELDFNFVDPGALPPHVRDAFAADDRIPEGPREWFGGQPIDHAPEETFGPQIAAHHRRSEVQIAARAKLSNSNLAEAPMARPHKQPLDPDTVARLRAEHHVQVDTTRNWAATLETAHRESPEATVTDLATVRAAREQGRAFAVIGEYRPDGSMQRPDGSDVPAAQVGPTVDALQAAVRRHPSGRTP